jgi:CubicO group peptidase (beta-lactamase class C family)
MNKHQILALSISLFLALGFFLSSTAPIAKDLPQTEQASNKYEAILHQFDLAARMKSHGVPGISFGIIKNGKLDWAKGYGVLQQGAAEKVNTATLFSVGSVSKVGAAVMILKLQEKGYVDIDKPVNNYLHTWQVPENEFTQKRPVLLRQILSHTAGLTVHGFADFYPNERLPNTVQILKGVSPAKNNPVYVNIPVGSRYRYSGGGTTVSQLVIEDQMSNLFYKVADSLLFQPLNMQRSSYQNPLPKSIGNIAKAHNRIGIKVALPRGYQSMPEAAASGLWTTPTDFSKLMIMLMKAHEGKSAYLSQATVKDMMTPVKPSAYGLGPHIKKEGNQLQFSHGGANDSYRAHFIGTLGKQNGIIIFTNGAGGSQLIEEILPLFEDMI